MLVIHSEQIKNLFTQKLNDNEVLHYQKTGIYQARLAFDNELVVTIINGVEESRCHAKQGQVVILGPLGEEYVIDSTRFSKRYDLIDQDELSDDYTRVVSKGQCHGFIYAGETFKFITSFGLPMLVEDGDILAVQTLDDLDYLYRIQKDAFYKTYSKVS